MSHYHWHNGPIRHLVDGEGKDEPFARSFQESLRRVGHQKPLEVLVYIEVAVLLQGSPLLLLQRSP